MTRWKLNGVLVIKHQFDHDPQHVHVYEDGRRTLRFDIKNWRVLSGELTAKVRWVASDGRWNNCGKKAKYETQKCEI